MESSVLNQQVKNLEYELHQTNIYLKDIAQSLQKISDKREENEEDDGK